MASLDNDVVEDRELNLHTKDGKVVTVSYAAAIAGSQLLNEAFAGKDDTETTLSMVEESVLQKVIEYLDHHVKSPAQEIPQPLENSDLSKYVSEWDFKFVTSLPPAVLREVAEAANYMNVTALLNLCAAQICVLMKGVTPAQMRANFGLPVSSMTAEEEKSVRAKNPFQNA